MKISGFILFLLILSSCGLAHYMGTKDPVDKTDAEIADYLAKIKFRDFDFSLKLNDLKYKCLDEKKHAIDNWKFERGTEQSTIQVRVYDSLGRLVTGYTQCYGDLKRLNIFKSENFRKIKHLPNNYNLKLIDEFEIWDLKTSDSLSILNEISNKKTIIIYWNIWSNYYSKIIFKELRKYLKKYDNRGQLSIILVNTDITYRKE